MSVLLLALLPLVVLLYALIASINHGSHYAPQAYYRRKRGGAPLALGYESLAPRHRRSGPAESRPQDLGATGGAEEAPAAPAPGALSDRRWASGGDRA